MESKSLRRRLSPNGFTALYEKAGRTSLVLGDAGLLVERQDLFESNPEYLAEFIHTLGVVPLPELTMQSTPRNEGWFVHRNAVEALRQPSVNVESEGAM